MKVFFLSLFLTLLAAASAPAADERGQKTTTKRSVVVTETAAPGVTVALCLESGNVVVHGWERNEVRARSEQAERIEMRSSTGTKEQPAKRLEVAVGNSKDEEISWGECSGSGNVELDVPHGATVQLKMQSGETVVSDVAEARVESLSGNVDLQRISRFTEVSSLSGELSLVDATGRVSLRAVSGDIEVENVRPRAPSDDFAASSTSGNINLRNVTHAQVKGVTINGSVKVEGALASRGVYDFRTTSGDVTLTLPANSSFRVTARVILGGEIITDFPLKTGPGTVMAKEHSQSRLTGTVGGGDAQVNLSSFNGTVHLKKM